MVLLMQGKVLKSTIDLLGSHLMAAVVTSSSPTQDASFFG